MTMEWKQDDSTGVEVIDVQHRALFGYTNQLERSIAAGISSGRDVDNLMGMLEGYSAAHFLYEEGCMRRHRCRLHKKNIREHAWFSQQVAMFSRSLDSDLPRLQVLRELHEMLEGWLVNHIVDVDSTLREKVLKPCKPAGEPLLQS